MPKIIIDTQQKRKRKTVRRERNNVFSEETNLFLLRLLRSDSELPQTLNNESVPNESVPVRNLQLELATAIRQRLLPWIGSIILHTVLLIILALMIFPVIHFEPLDTLSGIANIPLPAELPIQMPLGNEVNDVSNATEQNQETQTATETPAEAVPKDEPVVLSPGLNFSGRDFNARETLLASGGGNGQTDAAVLAGLRWLVSVQQPNGAWDFRGTFPQSSGERQKNALAATAMALIAFQGYGITPESRHPQLLEFARPVRRGWDWLLTQQNPDGSFFPLQQETNQNHRFYTHGFCTVALCEWLVMTGDRTLHEPAQRAVDYCVRHQSLRSGGWRYLPDRFSDQSDVSVTGWIVLALKSGQAAGLTVPPEVYEHVMQFLDSMMVDNRYKYREEEPEPRISMTAEALLCRILLGWKRDDPRLIAGVQSILETPPSFADHYQRDVYYWFFASQTLYHYGGEKWQTWNSLMREELLKHQEEYGAEKGSWNSHRPVRDRWVQYGRHYTTCMSLYILEVYYRHRRIFDEEK